MENMKIKKPIEISKELEAITFKSFGKKKNKTQTEKSIRSKGKKNIKSWMTEFQMPNDKDNGVNSLFATFQKAMKILLVCGQCIGLNPVEGILEMDVYKVRFSWISAKVVYSLTLASVQALVAGLCFYKLFHDPITVPALGFVSFYLSTSCTTFIFISIATQWPKLLKDISNSGLDKYVDKRSIKYCKITTYILLAMSLMEHVLSLISKSAQALVCPGDGSFYEQFVRITFPWFYDLDMPYNLPTGIFLQYVNVLSTINWNYSDMFIVCISLYLTSVLEQVNARIVAASDKGTLLTSVWEGLREDYTRAVKLVKLFDDLFSSVVLLSFASNLFFICLQLFNILTNGLNHRANSIQKTCKNYCISPFLNFHAIYLMYSVAFLFGRFLTVSLVAAKVHRAAQAPASAMYNVPATAYCKEVERFLDQVHGDTVALSGLKFFYITRELVLTVAGTIVTYELVLLQFSSDDIKKAPDGV